jgi:4'-phosphopantetheinyl transferase
MGTPDLPPRILCRATLLDFDSTCGPVQAVAAVAVAPLPWLEGQGAHFLAPAEAALLDGSLHPRRRHGVLLGRFAAKRALGLLLPDIDPRSLAIEPGVLGQPVLSGSAGVESIQVSLSHAGSVAVAVVFPAICPMGVDVERITPDQPAALDGLFTPAEARLAAAAGEGGAARLWCLKEALSKALRCGLSVPLPVLVIAALPADGSSSWADFTNFRAFRGLSLTTGRLAAALVVPRLVTMRAGLDGWLDDLAAADRLIEPPREC